MTTKAHAIGTRLRRRSYVFAPLPLCLWFPLCAVHNLTIWLFALAVSHLSRLLLPTPRRERLRLAFARLLGWERGSATLFAFPYSHYCEAARWCLDGSGVTYREVTFATPNHVPAQLAYLGSSRRPTLPFLLDEEGNAVLGSDGIAEWCGRRGGGGWLFPGGGRAKEGVDVFRRQDDRFGGCDDDGSGGCNDRDDNPTRRWLAWLQDDVHAGSSVYILFRHLFHYRGRDGRGTSGRVMAQIWYPYGEDASSVAGKFLCQACALPLTRAFIPLRKIEPRAMERVERALEQLGREAGGDGAFLSRTDVPSAADVFACSLLGMYTVFPREDLVCAVNELPEDYEDMVRRWRQSPGGRYILRVYENRRKVYSETTKKKD